LYDGLFNIEELCYGVGEHWLIQKLKVKI